MAPVRQLVTAVAVLLTLAQASVVETVNQYWVPPLKPAAVYDVTEPTDIGYPVTKVVSVELL